MQTADSFPLSIALKETVQKGKPTCHNESNFYPSYKLTLPIVGCYIGGKITRNLLSFIYSHFTHDKYCTFFGLSKLFSHKYFVKKKLDLLPTFIQSIHTRTHWFRFYKNGCIKKNLAHQGNKPNATYFSEFHKKYQFEIFQEFYTM